MRILLRTAISPHSGYGRDGIDLAASLTEDGHEVFLEPLAVATPLPHTIRSLLARETPPECDLAIHHTDPQTLATNPLQPHHLKYNRYNVAWTMWESPWWPLPLSKDDTEATAGLTWVPTLAPRLASFDAIATYDPVTYEAFTEGLRLHMEALFDKNARRNLYLPDPTHHKPEDYVLRKLNFEAHRMPYFPPRLGLLARRASTIYRLSDEGPEDSPSVRSTLSQLAWIASRTFTVQGGFTPPPSAYNPSYNGLSAHLPPSADLWSAEYPPQTRDQTDTHAGPLKLLHFSEMNDRKNVAAAIEAVKLCRDNGLHVELTLKGSSDDAALIAELMPTHKQPWLHHIPQLLPRQKLLSLIREHHAGIFPSRGEGKNLPALEMMAHEKPVILTNVGGHAMYATPTNSYLIPVQTNRPARMVNVRVKDIADAIQAIYENPRDAAARGREAAASIRPACSWTRATARLLDKLRAMGMVF